MIVAEARAALAAASGHLVPAGWSPRDPRVALGPAPRGRNGYCGPTAVAALTGVSTEQASAIMRHVGGRRQIRGAYNHEVVGAVRALGYRVHEVLGIGSMRGSRSYCDGVIRVGPKPVTLGQFLGPAHAELRRSWRGWVVLVTGHYIAVAGDWCVDTSHRQPTPAAEFPRQRRRVKALFALELV